MTAQVAILNKMGVALASDSAVTVGRKKVFNTANKVFTLSKYHPVGVMVYGSASFMGVPYETVIKTFREELGDDEFPYLEGYVDAFKRYLASRRFRDQEAQRHNVINIAAGVFTSFESNSLKEKADEKGLPVEKLEVKDIREALIAAANLMRRRAPAKGFGRVTPASLLRRYKTEIHIAREHCCKWQLWKTASTELAEFCALVMRSDYFASSRSGIVIAGYGKRSYFPEIFDLHTEGLIADKLKLRTRYHGRVQHSNGAIIVPLAQTDMVTLFMQGVDRGYQRFLEKSVPQLISRIAGSIVDSNVKGSKAKLQKIKEGLIQSNAVRKILDTFWQAAKGYRSKWVTNDIVRVVASLPKADLAGLAEALVNLTSTKRQVTPQQETVGGPVDVAVISKGDGFIWIKRKHYFDAQLNQHFLDRYFRD